MYNLILILGLFTSLFSSNEEVILNHSYLDTQIQMSVDNFESEVNEYKDYLKELEYKRTHFFKGESSEVIAKKIDKFMHSTLKGKGKFITEYSLSIGLDPYLAASVMLQETGCYWTCSRLTRSCNNVGGNKGKPGCNGGSYRKFDTLEEGMKFAMKKLNSYYKKGYTTAAQINPFYATDKTWHEKVQRYYNRIKKTKV